MLDSVVSCADSVLEKTQLAWILVVQITYIRVKLSELHLIFLKFFLKSNYTDYTDYAPRSH